VIGTGTLLNAAGIVAGGVLGLSKTPFSAGNQNFSKLALAAFTAFCGLRLTWISLNGSMAHLLKHLGIILLALVLGKLAGRLLRLQKASNRLGRYARERISAAKPDDPDRFYKGFLVCTALFCAAPLGIIGAIQDGVSGYFLPLAAKAFMDGLATMGFISMFGAGVIFSVVPVLVLEGTVTLLCARFAEPWLVAHSLIDPLNATGGMLLFCIALLMMQWRKIEVTDYLPSLLVAPALALWLHW